MPSKPSIFVRLLQRFGCFKTEEKKEEKITLPPLALDDETMQPPTLAHTDSLTTLDSARLNTGVKRLSKMLDSLKDLTKQMQHLSGELDSVKIDASTLQGTVNTIIEHIEKRQNGAKNDTLTVIDSAIAELNKIQSSPLFDTPERKKIIKSIQASLKDIKNKTQAIVLYQHKRASDIKEQENTLDNKIAELKTFLKVNIINVTTMIDISPAIRNDPNLQPLRKKDEDSKQIENPLPSNEKTLIHLELAWDKLVQYEKTTGKDKSITKFCDEIKQVLSPLPHVTAKVEPFINAIREFEEEKDAQENNVSLTRRTNK